MLYWNQLPKKQLRLQKSKKEVNQKEEEKEELWNRVIVTAKMKTLQWQVILKRKFS